MPAPKTPDVLSASALDVLSAKEEDRKVIPATVRQEELAKVGELATSAAKFPAPGEGATLTFSDGTTQDVGVTGYDKNGGKPLVQIGVGNDQGTASNIDMGAFKDLTQPKG